MLYLIFKQRPHTFRLARFLKILLWIDRFIVRPKFNRKGANACIGEKQNSVKYKNTFKTMRVYNFFIFPETGIISTSPYD
jgi:hypothetical protein